MGKQTEALTLVGILLMIPTFAFIIYYFLIKEKPINYDAEQKKTADTAKTTTTTTATK